MRLSQSIFFIFIFGFMLNTYAAFSTLGIQNSQNDKSFYFLSHQSANRAACQNTCKNILKPNEQQFITIDASEGWIDLEYNICANIKNNNCDDYRGHVGILLTPEKTSISNTQDGSAFLNTIEPGKIFGVIFHSAISSRILSPTFPTPAVYTGVKYHGFNLSGGEFDSAFNLPYATDALYFIRKGANILRIPFKWEYIQPDLSKPIDFSTGNAKKLNDLVTTFTKAHLFVILDMHNFLRYPSNNFQGPVIGNDANATTEKFALAWGSFAKQFKNNNYVFFDLMNEPLADPELILKNYNAALDVIRKEGFDNLVLLEGSDWSKMSTWTNKNAKYFIASNIHDPQNNYALSIHQYFDDEGGSTNNCFSSLEVLTKIHFDSFVTWIKTQKVPIFLTELGGANNQNCADTIQTVLTAVENHPDENHAGGFIGWAGWMGGHATSGFLLNLMPDANGIEKIQMTKGFSLHLKKGANYH